MSGPNTPSPIIGTATLTYEIPGTSDVFTDNMYVTLADIDINLEEISGVFQFQTSDYNFPVILNDRTIESQGITLGIFYINQITVNQTNNTNTYTYNISVSNQSNSISFNYNSTQTTQTAPTNINISLVIPGNTYNNNIIISEANYTYNYLQSNLTTSSYSNQGYPLTITSYNFTNPTITNNLALTSTFSPAALTQAATTRDQASEFLTTLDPRYVFLSRDQQNQIASEAGLIAGYSVSIGESVQKINDTLTKK